MERRSLNGRWEFRRADGEGPWRAGEVPGGVYGDLERAGVIDDPLYGDNELDVQWVGETDWTYRRTVTVDAALLEHERVILAFDGLDTVATVSVNGEVVGASENMHVEHAFDVGDALAPGENDLRVAFESPVAYAAERAADYPHEVPCIRYPVDQPNRPFVRKAQCQFGWDWGPCLPTMGIYRDVDLLAYDEPRIDYVTTAQDHHGEGRVDLSVRVGLDVPTPGEYDLSVRVAGAERTERVALEAGDAEVETELAVGDVDLWWPAGYGDQPLYDLEVGIGPPDPDPGERPTDTRTERIGFRELETVVEPDDAGTAFRFEVNGTPVFAKGANAVPVAPTYAGVTRERYEHVLESAVAANMNTVRVWGGGYYEDDAFYELCDELGLLVWQDFMFACSLYPADDPFLESVEREVRHQVRRLATHPSIALWCAHNENEEALESWFGDHEAHDEHVREYEALYAGTVGPACREEDPSRTFWPGSPSSGPADEPPRATAHGDVHYWEVWHGGRPFEDYTTTEPRFVSEFGYQSFPSIESLRTVLPDEQLNATAPLMEHHQRHERGNAIVLGQFLERFRMPETFADQVYLSQVQQGLAMGTAIEHWRRLKPTTMGALYWQLNVLWPVASWSSLEYDGAWKAQQYMARRQFAPVLVSLAPEDPDGDDGGDSNPRGFEVWVTSDVDRPLEGTVDVSVHTLDGGTVLERRVDADVDALASEPVATVGRRDVGGVAPGEAIVRARYTGPEESYAAHGFFAPFKAYDLADPGIDATVDGPEVTVRAEETALFVALDAPIDGAFSDNYVHLLAGEERTVTFEPFGAVRDALVGVRLEDGLSVRSLRDTY